MWNIYNLLPYERMEPRIGSEEATIHYVRLAVEQDLRRNTVYVSPGANYCPGHDVVILHREDMIVIDGEDYHEVFNRVATIVDRFNSWERKLMAAEDAEDGVQTMLDNTQSFLPGGFYALTYGGRTLGLSCPDVSPLRRIWDEFSWTQDLSYERMYLMDKYFDFSGFVPGAPMTTKRAKSGEFYYSYRSVDNDEQNIGFLVYCCLSSEPPRGTALILDKLAEHMLRYFTFHVSKINLVSRSSEMLQRLLKSDQPGDEVKQFFHELHWDPFEEFCLVAINCGVRGKSSEIIRSCRALFRSPLFCAMGSDLIMLLNLSQEPPLSSVMGAFFDLMADGCSCGVSNYFHNLYGAKLYCSQAIEELRRAEATSGRWSLAYDHSMEYYNNALLSAPLSRCYVDRSLVRLASYDGKNGTEHYLTMRAYILSGFHTSDAARILNVHRNTFLYRLEQIRDIIDLNAFEHAFRSGDMDRISCYHVSIFILDRLREQGPLPAPAGR